MNPHATKSILEHGVTPGLFFTSLNQLIQPIDQLVVNDLAVMVGDASVWSDVLQKIPEG